MRTDSLYLFITCLNNDLTTTSPGNHRNLHTLYLSSISILNTETDTDRGEIMEMLHVTVLCTQVLTLAMHDLSWPRGCSQTTRRSKPMTARQVWLTEKTATGAPVRDEDIKSVASYPHVGNGTVREATFRMGDVLSLRRSTLFTR